MTYKFVRMKLDAIFSKMQTGDIYASAYLENGSIPLISCKTEKTRDHGVEGYFEIPKDKGTCKNCVTITCDGDMPSTAFFHPYQFAVKDNVFICIPKKGVKLTTILYAIASLNGERWRYSYGKKCYDNKKEKLTVPFPVDGNGKIDQEAIEKILNIAEMSPIVAKPIQKFMATFEEQEAENNTTNSSS